MIRTLVIDLTGLYEVVSQVPRVVEKTVTEDYTVLTAVRGAAKSDATANAGITLKLRYRILKTNVQRKVLSLSFKPTATSTNPFT